MIGITILSAALLSKNAKNREIATRGISLPLRLTESYFKKIIGFELPYFPMENLLNLAYSKDFLAYNNVEKKYIPNYNLINKNQFMKNIYVGNATFEKLINDFINYSYSVSKETISKQEAENIINQFIEEQGMLLFNEKEKYFNNSHQDYLFASYLEYIFENDKNRFNYINDLIVGRIFAEFVFYESSSDTRFFNNLNAYLDTGFMLRLLGIDGLNRKSIYQDLLNQMHNSGIKTYLFDHTYNEITTIILNSIQWINNPDYNPYVANETTHFFVTNNYTKEQIVNILENLSSELKSLNIEIKDIEYPQNVPLGVLREADYYEAINDYYKEHNINFDEDEKQYTVELDAKSFFYVDYLAKGIIANDIKDAKHLFVTTNLSLSRISKNILFNNNKLREYSIPLCVTDRFLGVILWKASPEKIRSDSYNRLLIAVQAAFSPSKEMMEKLTEALHENLEAGEITIDESYMIKTSREAHRYLMKITNGDPEVFTVKTTLEILKEIHDDAKQKGIDEERIRANEEIGLISDELQRQKDSNNKLIAASIQKDIEIYREKIRRSEESKDEKSKRLEYIQKKEINMDKKVNKRIKILLMLVIPIIIMYIITGVFVWQYFNDIDFLSVYNFVVASIGLLLGYIYFVITGKSFNVLKWKENIKENITSKEFKKYDIRIKEKDELIYQINNLEADIKHYNEEIEKLGQ